MDSRFAKKICSRVWETPLSRLLYELER